MIKNCNNCSFHREIKLSYRQTYNDIICCHPNIARKAGWEYAGKIIENIGACPIWCPKTE